MFEKKGRTVLSQLATRLTNAPELSARRFEVSTRAIRSKQASRESVNRPGREKERERVRMKEVPRSSGRWGGGVGTGEFTLSSFPGFIFRAPSTKLLEISLVLFSSDNATLAARAKGWFNEKTSALYPVGRMRWKRGRERK